MSGAVVVTGGASGIGFATARLLNERGWHPWLLDLNREALDAACDALALPRDHGVALSVTDEAAVEAAMARVAADGPLAGVVN